MISTEKGIAEGAVDQLFWQRWKKWRKISHVTQRENSRISTKKHSKNSINTTEWVSTAFCKMFAIQTRKCPSYPETAEKQANVQHHSFSSHFLKETEEAAGDEAGKCDNNNNTNSLLTLPAVKN